MSAADKVIGQCRKPSGLFGRLMLWEMNRHHSKLTDWGLSHVTIKKTDTILDIGCGGGRTISKLATMASDGKVHGVDYSEQSVTAAHRANIRWIDIGRVSIREGTVSKLDFADNTFDLVTGIETHLFWPDLPRDFREIYRVLKPLGTLLLVAEIYKGGKHLEGVRKQIFDKHLAANMNLLSPDEHRDLFSNAGFVDVEIFEMLEKGWICAFGRKPFSGGVQIRPSA
jgi:ubiquinone/menaquinone biosynthesis C-methylase UbiE